MLKISSYSLRGQLVRVKLKCTCGNSRIFEVQEYGKHVYFCSKCRSRKTLEELKKEASSYWRSRNWTIECEPDQRAQPRVQADIPVTVTVKATQYSPEYCTLSGRCVILSESGMLVLVSDFRESYFSDITSACRYAEVTGDEPLRNLPSPLVGRIVGVKYRPDQLPQCRVGVAFESLGKEATEAVRRFVQARTPSTSQEFGENLPPIDKPAEAP